MIQILCWTFIALYFSFGLGLVLLIVPGMPDHLKSKQEVQRSLVIFGQFWAAIICTSVIAMFTVLLLVFWPALVYLAFKD